MASLPDQRLSSIYDAVYPNDSSKNLASSDSLRHLEPHSTLRGKFNIARGAGHALLAEARSAVSERAIYAIALGVCTAIDVFDTDKSGKETR